MTTVRPTALWHRAKLAKQLFFRRIPDAEDPVFPAHGDQSAEVVGGGAEGKSAGSRKPVFIEPDRGITTGTDHGVTRAQPADRTHFFAKGGVVTHLFGLKHIPRSQ